LSKAGNAWKQSETSQCQLVQLALAWLLQKSPVMLPIPGTSSLAHLEENMAAAKLQLMCGGVEEDRRAGAPGIVRLDG